MTLDTDLPQQSDTYRQHSSLIKKKSNPIWKVIFILLVIVNLIFACWILYIGSLIFIARLVSNYPSDGGPAIGILGIVGYSFLLVPIDLIAVLFYGRPHGKLRVLTYIALISVSFPLIIYFVIVPIVYFGRFIFLH